MNLSDLFSFLTEIGHRPNKRLSQNFLIDQNIVNKIVQLAEVSAKDQVLEIGPGPGILTKYLLAQGAFVLAIETDPRLAGALERLQTDDRRLTVVHADFLKYSFKTLNSPWKVVANFPYHITTPILEKIFEHASLFSSITFMVQKEVASRIFAKKRTKEYSSFSLFAQFYTHFHSMFNVPANCFYPKPNVDSVVIRLDLKEPPLKDSTPFFLLTRTAFQKRRKMLTSSLAKLHPGPKIQQALIAIGASPKARPEELSLDEWLLFFHQLQLSQ
jgi:16S rRNA (adenine1518-N6/adenine1519-N6)-dimethyltransferase